MEKNNRPPIEANITPHGDIGVHLNRLDDGSITLFTVGNIESGGKTARDREIIITFQTPIHESSVQQDKQDYTSQLTKQAEQTFRTHVRNSTRR